MPQFYEQAPEMQEVSMDSFIKEKMQLKKEKENEALHCMYVVYYKLKGLADWHIWWWWPAVLVAVQWWAMLPASFKKTHSLIMNEARKKRVKLSADDLLIRIQTWEFWPTKTHQGFTSWTKLPGTTKRAVFYCTGLKPCFKAAAQVMSMRSMSTTPTSWCVHCSKACTNAPAWHACTTPLGIVIYKTEWIYKHGL